MKIADITADIGKLKEFEKLNKYKRRELMSKYFCNSCDNYATKLIKS